MSEIIRLKKTNRGYNNSIFNDFKFLSSIINTSGGKAVFRHIHSTGDAIYSTDSRRLFVSEGVKFEKGNFELLIRKANEIVLHRTEDEEIEGLRFPNIKAVIGNCTFTKVVKLAFNKYSSSSFTKLARALPNNCGIYFEHIKELNGHTWNVHISDCSDGLKPIMFQREDAKYIKAYFMPVSVNEED